MEVLTTPAYINAAVMSAMLVTDRVPLEESAN